MPTRNRHVVSGGVFHLTHRCHDRAFLLKHLRARDAYRGGLREGLKAYPVSLLGYCITCNHVHLLAYASAREAVTEFMQQVQGSFERSYNAHKKRTEPFWAERYHVTMVQAGEHLVDCMRYIDLNMVRAGVVHDPEQWAWNGYQEVFGHRMRCRLLDRKRIAELVDLHDWAVFQYIYRSALDRALQADSIGREAKWTEAVAVGSEAFVRSFAEREALQTEFAVGHTSSGRG